MIERLSRTIDEFREDFADEPFLGAFYALLSLASAAMIAFCAVMVEIGLWQAWKPGAVIPFGVAWVIRALANWIRNDPTESDK